MTRYVIRRIGFILLTLVIASMIVFLITQFLPGDTCRVILGREAGEAALETCRHELGLDKPLPVQYLSWLKQFISGDWGNSYSTRLPIYPLVIDRLRNSIWLAGAALIIAVPVSIFLGVIAGVNENRLADHVISIGGLSVVGLPEFVTGLVLISIFAFWLKILPANSSIPPGTPFLEAVPMLILPALTITLVLLAYIARLTRNGVVEELKKPYVRTADLKGLPRRVVIGKHVLRNALLPTITVIAISIGWLISGLVVVENVFNYPGLGRLMVFAIDRHDLPLMQAVMMITVMVFAVANLGADLLYAVMNPRIRVD